MVFVLILLKKKQQYSDVATYVSYFTLVLHFPIEMWLTVPSRVRLWDQTTIYRSHPGIVNNFAGICCYRPRFCRSGGCCCRMFRVEFAVRMGIAEVGLRAYFCCSSVLSGFGVFFDLVHVS